MATEQIIVFPGAYGQMIGTLHSPDKLSTDKGVLLAVGGPQTRTGSHRQFLLLARFLADNGVPVFRFDYSGMGDSEGEKREYLDACSDLEKAIECFLTHTNIKKYVFWGLCDAASLGLMYLSVKDDDRLTDFIALNPWVRQSHTEAQAYLKSYYLQKLTDRDFWKKVFSLKFDYLSAIRGFAAAIVSALRKSKSVSIAQTNGPQVDAWPSFTAENYVGAMLQGVKKLSGNLHIVLSGNDLTAEEFQILIKNDSEWSQALTAAKGKELVVSESTHTFSSQIWRQQVEAFSLEVCL